MGLSQNLNIPMRMVCLIPLGTRIRILALMTMTFTTRSQGMRRGRVIHHQSMAIPMINIPTMSIQGQNSQQDPQIINTLGLNMIQHTPLMELNLRDKAPKDMQIMICLIIAVRHMTLNTHMDLQQTPLPSLKGMNILEPLGNPLIALATPNLTCLILIMVFLKVIMILITQTKVTNHQGFPAPSIKPQIIQVLVTTCQDPKEVHMIQTILHMTLIAITLIRTTKLQDLTPMEHQVFQAPRSYLCKGMIRILPRLNLPSLI